MRVWKLDALMVELNKQTKTLSMPLESDKWVRFTAPDCIHTYKLQLAAIATKTRKDMALKLYVQKPVFHYRMARMQYP